MKRDGAKIDAISFIYKNSILILAVAECIIFQLLSQGVFLTGRNLSNLLLQGATCSVIAITMSLVIITKNSDLSAGRLLGMFGMLAAIMQVKANISGIVVVVLIYAIAIFVGYWHGFWIGKMQLPAFIVTLTTQLIFFGICQFMSSGMTIGPVSGVIDVVGSGYIPHISKNYNDTSLIIGFTAAALYLFLAVLKEKKNIAQGLIQPRWNKVLAKVLLPVLAITCVSVVVFLNRGFSYSMLVLFLFTCVVTYIVSNTKFGRYIYAIGGNKEAARMSGINVSKEIIKLYILHTVLVATAALVYVGRVGNASTAAGQGYEFTAITGCVVGGVAISGGRGTVVGAVVGTMIMAGLDNGMSLLNLHPALQYIVRGIVLLCAISLDAVASDRKAKTLHTT